MKIPIIQFEKHSTDLFFLTYNQPVSDVKRFPPEQCIEINQNRATFLARDEQAQHNRIKVIVAKGKTSWLGEKYANNGGKSPGAKRPTGSRRRKCFTNPQSAFGSCQASSLSSKSMLLGTY